MKTQVVIDHGRPVEHPCHTSFQILNADKGMAAQALMDKVETIYALSDGLTYAQEVIDKVGQVFSDDKASVTFSTIHRAKGLEANRVFILRPDLLPHPMAKKDWERQSERNIEYVGLTRAKKELYIVTGST